MPKLLVCLFCLLCAAGCAQTGPNSYGMDVNTIIKGISQGKLIVDSTEVVDAYFYRSYFYGNSMDPSFDDNERGPRIQDGYITADFRNVSKEPLKLVIENHWVRARPENLPPGEYNTSENIILTTETETGIVKPGQMVSVKIPIPEGLGRVEYEGCPGERDV